MDNVLWAAIGGGIGGAVGSLLATLLVRFFPENWRKSARSMVVVIFAVIGWRSAVAWHEFNAAEPATLESRLLADPEVGRVLQSWKDAEPASFQAAIQRISVGARSGQNYTDRVNAMRADLLAVAVPRFRYLDDAQTLEMIRINQAEFQELATTRPQVCKPMFMGEPFGDVSPYLSANVRSREFALFEAAFRANTNTQPNVLTGQSLEQALNAVLETTRNQVGEDFALLGNGADISGREVRHCQIVSTFFEQMSALPPADAASLMRGLRATP